MHQTFSYIVKPLLKKFNFKNLIFHQAIFFFIVLNLAACNATVKEAALKTDTIQPPTIINSTKPISATEKQRLYSACKLWFDTVLGNKGFNGAMIVAKQGNIVFETYNGTGHLPGNDSINANTPFHIASVSKTFTAMMVLLLAQQKHININDEYSKYFPSFNYPSVTIKTLLNHRSGLPNYVYFMEKLGWDKTKYVSNNDVLNYLINKKTQLTNIVTPNTKFTYCNTNYALLALLIEKVTNEKYTAFLQKNVFVPLQMNNSFVFDTAMLNKVNNSYDWRNRIMPFNYLDAVYGDKNIYSTVQDLLKWDRAISNSNMFTKHTLDEAYTPYSNEKNGVRNYGLGWRMFVYPNGKKIIYHNGWWHGNNACFVRLIEDDATIIIVGNKFNRNIYHGRELANLFSNYTPVNGEEENETTKDSVTDNTTLTDKQLLLNAKLAAPKALVKNRKLVSYTLTSASKKQATAAKKIIKNKPAKVAVKQKPITKKRVS